ncbi:hypothetical protein AAVH_00007 [Aphelenchoides avenae]|nr:hypothetical protein AAVH_00007 [Aphelenchus avenae]
MSDKEEANVEDAAARQDKQRKRSRSRSPNRKHRGNDEQRSEKYRSQERYSDKSRRDADDREQRSHKEDRYGPHRKYDKGSRDDYNRSRDGKNWRDNRNYDKDRDDARSDDRPSWDNNRVKRHMDKIQQRKLLWSKPKGDAESSTAEAQPSSSDKAEKNWTSMLAAATTDSKELTKYQRLMGLKKTAAEPKPEEEGDTSDSELPENDVEAEKRRQQKLQQDLEQQYAAARATTHMARGRGLGFM